MPMKRAIKTPERVDIFGTKFSAVDLDSATKFLTENAFDEPGYVCFPSTSSVSRAYKNRKFQQILNSSLLTLADGKFTEYYARMKGYSGVKNVSGYWLMEKLLQTELTHYFYGCDDETLNKLKNKLSEKFPKAKILGFKAPPFVTAEEIKNNTQIAEDFFVINRLRPDLIWIGISGLKQDYLMHYFQNQLERGTMLGVGAVFLYHAGVVNKGPEILKRLALRWLYRLVQEPVRILKKNVAIPGMAHFLFLIVKYDLLNIKKTKDIN
jgi:N-acetylglucosaminyldiphosphoundecaprenol N-acetyl-beta-D-mannosaminyltransferase